MVARKSLYGPMLTRMMPDSSTQRHAELPICAQQSHSFSFPLATVHLQPQVDITTSKQEQFPAEKRRHPLGTSHRLARAGAIWV